MWEFLPPQVRLRGAPRADERTARQLREDYERFRDGLPRPLEPYVLATYAINLASAYAKRALLYRAKGFTQEAEQDIQSFVLLNTKPEGEEIFDNEEAETDSQKVM